VALPKYTTRTHKLLRKQYAVTIRAGQGWCAETVCLEERDGRTRFIPPDTPWSGWDVPHNDDGVTYKDGPAHARCNRADGGRRHGKLHAEVRRRVL
jgi:hypothetical protein